MFRRFPNSNCLCQLLGGLQRVPSDFGSKSAVLSHSDESFDLGSKFAVLSYSDEFFVVMIQRNILFSQFCIMWEYLWRRSWYFEAAASENRYRGLIKDDSRIQSLLYREGTPA